MRCLSFCQVGLAVLVFLSGQGALADLGIDVNNVGMYGVLIHDGLRHAY